MSRRLYELVAADGASFSPFVWRIKYALAHKGLDYESQGVGFIDIPLASGARFKTVPILEDGSEAINDSWVIADYLDRAYPDRPMLFTSPAERAMVQFFEKWFATAALPAMFRAYVPDIFTRIRPADIGYFRTSREQRLGQTLESLQHGREELVEQARQALQPMRVALKDNPFLGGEQPNYADFIALGMFIWVGTVATLPLLAPDDTLLPWLERGLDLYGKIGRANAFRALIG